MHLPMYYVLILIFNKQWQPGSNAKAVPYGRRFIKKKIKRTIGNYFSHPLGNIFYEDI